ncbi:MAG: GbsR/MarR family transcriptional regulator [Planctomycetota bacterium]|jgi:DNA-binding transcriptional regulator GbsR (MarR family)
MATPKLPKPLAAARAEFLASWGALGPNWGVSRTMSQIHALAMVSPEPLNTDTVMAELQISRGNAHANIKELCDWGLLRKVAKPGDRKDYYEAEKDVWRVVQCIARVRRRKEIEPVLQTLDGCLAQTKGGKDPATRAFRRQLSELQRFAQLGDRVLGKVTQGASGRILPWILRFLK